MPADWPLTSMLSCSTSPDPCQGSRILRGFARLTKTLLKSGLAPRCSALCVVDPLVALVIGVFVIAPRSAEAGNLDSYYLSGEAALQGGAVTADTNHGGAIWYNPSGLADMRGSSLDASVSAYGLHWGGHPDVDAGALPAQTKRLTPTDFRIVPAALSYAMKLGRVTVGFGVFVPQQETLLLRSQIRWSAEPRAGTTSTASEFGVDYSGRQQDYFIGPSVGLGLAKRVNFGASLFVVYRNAQGIGDAYLAYGDTMSLLTVQTHTAIDWQQVGLQPVLGLQLTLQHGWRVGFALRLPTYRIYEVRQTIETTTSGTSLSGGNGDSTLSSDYGESSGFSTGMLLPARMHAGSSYAAGRGRVAIDLSYQEPYHNEAHGIDWAPTVNARVGARYRYNDDWTVGGGLFTDRSPMREARRFGDTKIDYFGATACLDWGSQFTAYRTHGSVAEPPSPLRFGTTLALSYAIGVGDVVSNTVDFTHGPSLTPSAKPVVAHEISLHLASSLAQ